MRELDKVIEDKFKELAEKVKGVEQPKRDGFSIDAVIEFCSGFDIPMIGIFEFLKEKAIAYYENINCHVVVQDGKRIDLNDHTDFKELLEEVQHLTPPIRLDFKISLADGFYTFSQSIEEFFSVWFQKENYIVGYKYGAEQELRFNKDYFKDLSVEEILSLRNQVALSVYNKISAQFEKAIPKK